MEILFRTQIKWTFLLSYVPKKYIYNIKMLTWNLSSIKIGKKDDESNLVVRFWTHLNQATWLANWNNSKEYHWLFLSTVIYRGKIQTQMLDHTIFFLFLLNIRKTQEKKIASVSRLVRMKLTLNEENIHTVLYIGLWLFNNIYLIRTKGLI